MTRNNRKNKCKNNTNNNTQNTNAQNVIPQNHNDLQTNSFQVQIPLLPKGMILISSEDHSALVKENRDLNLRILELVGNERILKETIDTKNKTIEELQKENMELKKRLELLEVECKEIRNENREIKKKLENRELKEKYNKILIAIQDLNRIESLEIKEPTIKKKLQSLRNNRVYECHYLLDGESNEHIKYKRKILYDKIITMDRDLKSMIDSKFPGLKEIIPLIKSGDDPIPDEDLELINDWWD